MATETVPRSTDIEDCLVLGKAFAALAEWVELARRIVDDVSSAREISPGLDQALKAQGICTGLDWGEVESSALVYLMQEITARFSALHEVHFPQEEATA